MTERESIFRSVARLLVIAVSVHLSVLAAEVFAQASFFQGKTITIVQGRDPGGSGDLRVRALVPFLEKYIPGNPKIVMEFMPGGGSRKAANYLFRTAKPDGLTIGNLSGGMVSLAVLGESGILYDLDKFNYLGSPYSTYHAVLVSRKEAGLDTIEKLRATPGLKLGAQSVGFSTFLEARVFAYILGLKDTSFIAGYSGVELDPALLRGEIDLRSNGADTIVQRNKDWLKGGVVNFHAITETPKGEKHPAFPNLPEIETFAKTPLDRKIIAMQRAFRVTGTPFVLPPATPKDRVQTLQDAFRKTYKDPEFAKHYQKLTSDEPSPLLPEDHEKAIRDVPREREAVEVFKRLANAVALPPRR